MGGMEWGGMGWSRMGQSWIGEWVGVGRVVLGWEWDAMEQMGSDGVRWGGRDVSRWSAPGWAWMFWYGMVGEMWFGAVLGRGGVGWGGAG